MAEDEKVPTPVPSWMAKVVITAVIGALVTGAAAWGKTLSSRTHDHETRVSVLEDHQKGIDKSLDEIKDTQKEQSKDTREILRMLRRR